MNDWYGAFRLNFEQQQKRAKDLLKAARCGEPGARDRFTCTPPKLAEAQYLIACELRFENWAALKRHVAAMAREREGMSDSVLDADLRTLHVRCGSDLKQSLREAGLHGDYCEHSYPYAIGPVREGAGALRQRAQFIVDTYSSTRSPAPEFTQVHQSLEDDERRLHDSADYDRVVIWSEGDSYDQLVLARLLGHYAQAPRPPRLELINTRDFPGALPFFGLGHLPPEALRLIWERRRRAGPAQLQVGLAAWKALANADPRPLAALMRTGTPALPLLSPALRRHLCELPSAVSGLSLTEEHALRRLSLGPGNLYELIGRMLYSRDALAGHGDVNILNRVLAMEQASDKPFTRRPGAYRDGKSNPPWTDTLEISALGRSLLLGEVDFRTLNPPPRWVGGVRVASDSPDWRWDNERVDAVCRSQGPSTS